MTLTFHLFASLYELNKKKYFSFTKFYWSAPAAMSMLFLIVIIPWCLRWTFLFFTFIYKKWLYSDRILTAIISSFREPSLLLINNFSVFIVFFLRDNGDFDWLLYWKHKYSQKNRTQSNFGFSSLFSILFQESCFYERPYERETVSFPFTVNPYRVSSETRDFRSQYNASFQ